MLHSVSAYICQILNGYVYSWLKGGVEESYFWGGGAFEMILQI